MEYNYKIFLIRTIMVYVTGKLEIGKGSNPEFSKEHFTKTSEGKGLFETIGEYTDKFGSRMKKLVFGDQ